MNGTNKENELKKNQFILSGSEVLPGEPNLPANLHIQTLFADIIGMVTRNDGISILRFFSRTPGANIEVGRIAIPQNILKSFIEMTCQVTGYYPEAKKQEIKANM